MINRQNWQDINLFLAYHADILQNDNLTIEKLRGALYNLLNWADDVSLEKAKSITPTFPVYMARRAAQSRHKYSSSESALKYARQFFTFARSEWYARYKAIPLSWIKTIQPSRHNSSHSRLKEHKHFSFEDVLKIAALYERAESLELRRDIAAVCFLFLSGMRIAAFCSLPLGAVDLSENNIYQLPENGVMTKNRKAAVTHLLQIPELLEVVKNWDSTARSQLENSDLWYPVMENGKDAFQHGASAARFRRQGFRKHLERVCNMAGVAFLSPHKLRHGHVVYALKNVKDMAGLKAVSQNVMHNSVQITDAIYGNFSNDDVKRVVSQIGAGGDDKAGAGGDLSALLSLLSNPDIQKAIAQATNGAKPTKKTKGK